MSLFAFRPGSSGHLFLLERIRTKDDAWQGLSGCKDETLAPTSPR
jgi:hypothetical protein